MDGLKWQCSDYHLFVSISILLLLLLLLLLLSSSSYHHRCRRCCHRYLVVTDSPITEVAASIRRPIRRLWHCM